MEINAGEIVEHAVRRQNVNISELSRRMKVNRRTLYNWFQQKSLNSDVICSIGQVINYDFSKDFNDNLDRQNLRTKGKISNINQNSKPESSETVNYWMEKYITLLEDYKKLLQNTVYESNFKNQ